jgi:predicted RNase H-like nuclease
VSIPGRWIQIPRGRRSYAGLKVDIRECLDGRLLAYHQGTLIARQASPGESFVLVSRCGGPARRVKVGLDQPRVIFPKTKREPLDQIYRKSSARKPRPVHPWRRGLPAWQPDFNNQDGG